jgi:predicted DNA-binding protein (MmcQ/YjbR family)
MNAESLRLYALSKPKVEESFPFGEETLVFKVNNKIFLLMGLDRHPLQFNVKCHPDKTIELREAYPENVLPGYHMNKKHWNTIIVNGKLSLKLLQSFIDDSYELVSSKR